MTLYYIVRYYFPYKIQLEFEIIS